MQTADVNRRIRMAWSAFGKLNHILRNRNRRFTTEMKIRVLNQCVIPVLTYATETWAFTAKTIHKMQVTQRNMERTILNIKRKDKKRIEWIREKTKMEDIRTTIMKAKWRWAGHVARMREDRWTRKTTEWKPWNQKMSQGRPMTRWYDDIRKIAGRRWMTTAQDRAMWKNLEEAYICNGIENAE